MKTLWSGVSILALAGTLWCQSTTQSIQGLVLDPSGAVVPRARISITNTATAVSQTVATNDTGNYSFQLVPAGDYDVRCEMQGFRTETVRGVRVQTAAQVRQDFRMQVGRCSGTSV